VRHRRVAAESPDHVTAEVLFLAHAARPHPTHPEKGALLTVVSQVDAKAKSNWLSSVFGQETNYGELGGLDVLNVCVCLNKTSSLFIFKKLLL
jgi:hypothetical protein